MEVFRGSYPSSFALPPHQSDNSVILTAALSQRTVQPFTSQLSSFASDPFLKKMIFVFWEYLPGGVLYSVTVFDHGWLGRGRLCVTFNEVKVLSERVCVIREMWVENPVEGFFAVSAEMKNKKSQRL